MKLNLRSAEDVKSACLDIQKSAGADLEGFLLQPQILGKREFVAGLFRDEQFGPVVMFGLGGVFTEVLADVVFRIAPFNEIQTKDLPGYLIQRFIQTEEPVSLQDVEKNLILKTLKEMNWNKHQVAKKLKITRSTLYGKMKRFGISKE